MVVPVHPSQGGELYVCAVVPGPLVGAADELGFVEADDGLGQRVVVGLSGQSRLG